MTSPSLARLSRRLFNAPLLITPQAAETVASALAERLGVEPMLETASPVPRAGFFDDDGGDDDEPYRLVDGVAVVPVKGELVNRGSWLNAASGLTSYEGLSASLKRAVADPQARGILLDMDSPGGEAAGAREAAEFIRTVSKQKKVVAYVNSLSASAGYWLASGASEIITPASSSLGSIGVVWLHLDRSKALAERGVKPTLIHAGAYKVDGNSMQALGDEARGRIQAQIDEIYGMFTASVGAHRPALGEAGARATEAGLYLGERAVATGLADRVGSMETALSAFPRRSFNGFGSSLMTDATFTQAHVDSQVASAVAAARRDAEATHATALEAACVAARADASQAERGRIRGILEHASAQGRGGLAMHFALHSDMSPESAATALEAAAKEPTSSRMSLVPKVDVKPGASAAASDAANADWSAIATDLNKTIRR